MGDILFDIFSPEPDNLMTSLMHEKTCFVDILQFAEHEPAKMFNLVDDHNMMTEDSVSPCEYANLKLPLLEHEPEHNNSLDVSSENLAPNSASPEQPCTSALQSTGKQDRVSSKRKSAASLMIPSAVSETRPMSGKRSEPDSKEGTVARRKLKVSAVSRVKEHSPLNGTSTEELSPNRGGHVSKLQRGSVQNPSMSATADADSPRKESRVSSGNEEEKSPRMTHITVERNRRKQMNEHLAVLRSLMPNSYVQRGDQASIIGGVVEFVKELQELLQTLEAQKKRRAYAEVLSPRGGALPPPISPRPSLNTRLSQSPRHSVSPRPQISPGSNQQIQNKVLAASNSSFPFHTTKAPDMPCAEMDGASSFEQARELVATSKSSLAEVEIKIAGSNAILRTLSQKAPGQVSKIVTALENLCLEILHLNITTIEETVLYAFTLKIGVECRLCVEDVAGAVQQMFYEIHSGTTTQQR